MSVDWPGRANNLVIKLTVLENEHYFFWSFILKCYFCGSAGDNLLILKSASEYFFELDFKKRELYTLS